MSDLDEPSVTLLSSYLIFFCGRWIHTMNYCYVLEYCGLITRCRCDAHVFSHSFVTNLSLICQILALRCVRTALLDLLDSSHLISSRAQQLLTT